MHTRGMYAHLKYRSTFNPYAGAIPVRFYGFDLSREAEQVHFTTPQEDGANVSKKLAISSWQ